MGESSIGFLTGDLGSLHAGREHKEGRVVVMLMRIGRVLVARQPQTVGVMEFHLARKGQTDTDQRRDFAHAEMLLNVVDCGDTLLVDGCIAVGRCAFQGVAVVHELAHYVKEVIRNLLPKVEDLAICRHLENTSWRSSRPAQELDADVSDTLVGVRPPKVGWTQSKFQP